MAAHDITHTLSRYLDRHLVLPLIDHLMEHENVFKLADLQSAKLELLSKTYMADLEKELFTEMNPGKQPPQEMEKRREEIMGRYQKIQEDLAPIIDLFENENVVAEISKNSNRPEALRDSLAPYGFKEEMIDTLETCSKFYFQIGQYEEAATFLYNFRVLSTDADKNFSALWGKLAAEILSEKWAEAEEDLSLLIEYIDGRNNLDALQQLQQRAWLLHWSLFVYFNRPDGAEKLIELFLTKPDYSNALQTVCPHLLRYVTALVLVHQRQRFDSFKALMPLVRQVAGSTSDPIVKLYLCINEEFDFETAHTYLKDIQELAEIDWFLDSIREELLESARRFIFETYCTVHASVSIKMVAERLGMTEDKAELWIVNLIRNAKMEAKIDTAEGMVVMLSQVPSIYQQVLDKTKNLGYRTRLINDHLEKRTKNARRQAKMAAATGDGKDASTRQ